MASLERVRVCVIGGAGFIGTQVTRQLAAAGRDVVVLGRRPNPGPELPREARYVAGDYGDRAVLQQVLRDVAEVIDLAYATVPQTSFADPIYDILANLQEAGRHDLRDFRPRRGGQMNCVSHRARARSPTLRRGVRCEPGGHRLAASVVIGRATARPAVGARAFE